MMALMDEARACVYVGIDTKHVPVCRHMYGVRHLIIRSGPMDKPVSQVYKRILYLFWAKIRRNL